MSAPSEFPKHGEVRRTVLEEPASAFSTAQTEEIAERAFELRASAHPLASERDQNYRLRTADGSNWVLKIANTAEDPELLDMQTRALLHIAEVDPDLPVPWVRATAEGAFSHEVGADDYQSTCWLDSYRQLLLGLNDSSGSR
jgi:Ser/Thr protein kinase RdoA (MazF antagonist)